MSSLLISSTVPEYETVNFCEDEPAEVECPEGYLIRPLEANFGRQGSDVCNEMGANQLTPLFTEEEMDCKNPKAFQQVCELCKGKRICEIPVTRKKFNAEEQCPGIPKQYLSFQYYCIKENEPGKSCNIKIKIKKNKKNYSLEHIQFSCSVFNRYNYHYY